VFQDVQDVRKHHSHRHQRGVSRCSCESITRTGTLHGRLHHSVTFKSHSYRWLKWRFCDCEESVICKSLAWITKRAQRALLKLVCITPTGHLPIVTCLLPLATPSCLTPVAASIFGPLSGRSIHQSHFRTDISPDMTSFLI